MIYLIFTATINNKYGILNDEHRKLRYIESISNTLKILENHKDIKAIIVENSCYGSSYFDGLGIDVVYTNNNQFAFKNKGINEFLDIQYVIQKYNMDDNDMIIKLTGRYFPFSDYFFKTVKENHDKDLIMKFYNVCKFKYMQFDCILGLFAIKCKFLKKFKPNPNFRKSIEVEFATFCRKSIKRENILELTNLDLECCFANNHAIYRF